VLRHDRTFILCLLVVLVAMLGLTLLSRTHGRSRQLVVSDGKAYYAWARSILLDGDIDFRNDYHLIFPPDSLPPEAARLTPVGLVVNKYPVGMAILETPGVLVGHLIANVLPGPAADGVSLPYQVAVVWSLILFSFFSFALLYRAMLLLGAERRWAGTFCLMMLLGTNLIRYVSREAAMAHAAGMAVMNVLLFLIARWGVERVRLRWYQGLAWGGLAGLLFLIRNTNILLLPVAAVLIWRQRRLTLPEAVPVVLGAAAISALQPLSLWLLWGTFRLSTYSGESFTAGLTGIIGALFSSRHGLFVHHPWYAALILLAGFAALRVARLRSLAAVVLGSVLLMTVANGTWHCWWFGHGFGNRAFIELLSPLSLVSALALSAIRPGKKLSMALLALAAVLVGLNFYLFIGYTLRAYPPDGSAGLGQVYSWGLHRFH
jgi:hypothetical protein